MSRRRFILEQFEEFLNGGDVATVHAGQIPIWAGFIIEQNARILEILETTVTSNESLLQADIAQLIATNTDVKATLTQQIAQITDLQGQIAALKSKAGDGTITADDLAQLDSAVADLASTAASAHATSSASATNPAGSTSVPAQQPITSAPVDPTQVGTTSAPAVPVQAPITSTPVADTSTPTGDGSKVSGADTGTGSDGTGSTTASASGIAGA